MKRALMVYMAIFLSAGFFSATQLHAAKKKGGALDNLPPAEEAGLRLLLMQQKGYIQMVIVDPDPLVYVEPLAWKNMTHRSKVDLGNLALLFFNGLKEKKGYKYNWVYLYDMSTKEHLGLSFPDDQTQLLHELALDQAEFNQSLPEIPNLIILDPTSSPQK